MISNDERREVAARLREQKTWDIFTDFECCIGDLCDAVFDDDGDINDMFRLQSALADLIDPTCHVVGTISQDWSDGSVIYVHDLSCGHTCETDFPEPPTYCDKCGARVVE